MRSVPCCGVECCAVLPREGYNILAMSVAVRLALAIALGIALDIALARESSLVRPHLALGGLQSAVRHPRVILSPLPPHLVVHLARHRHLATYDALHRRPGEAGEAGRGGAGRGGACCAVLRCAALRCAVLRSAVRGGAGRARVKPGGVKPRGEQQRAKVFSSPSLGSAAAYKEMCPKCFGELHKVEFRGYHNEPL